MAVGHPPSAISHQPPAMSHPPSATDRLPPWARVRPARLDHIARVAALAERWARERGVSEAESRRWQRAAWLHDALKDVGPAELARWTPQGDWPLPVWHAPAAAAAAEAHGESDHGVLDAIRYHPIGFDGWDDAGRILFLADYLEPGREGNRERRAEWASRVPRELDAVLREVLAARITHLLERGTPIRRETLDLWNQLAARG